MSSLKRLLPFRLSLGCSVQNSFKLNVIIGLTDEPVNFTSRKVDTDVLVSTINIFDDYVYLQNSFELTLKRTNRCLGSIELSDKL